jgi:hypothetical protein
MRDWISSRRLSLLVAVGYGFVMCVLTRPKSAREVVIGLLITVAFVALPLACIWFSDEMGDYVGALPGPSIQKPSPAWMVSIGGWVLLLLPVVIWFFSFRA